MERFTIYEDPQYYAAFPSVATLGDGRAIVAFRRASDPRSLHPGVTDAALSHLDPRSHLAWIELDDKLISSSAPRVAAIDPDAADQHPSLLALADGTVVLASFAWKPVPAAVADACDASRTAVWRSGVDGLGYLGWGCSVRRRGAGAANFGRPRYFVDGQWPTAIAPLSPLRGGALRGGMCERGDRILAATYGSLARAGRGAASARDRVFVYASSDGGETFHYQAEAMADPTGAIEFHEPTLLARADGVLTVLARTTGAEGRLASSSSTDGGLTFSPWRIEEVRAAPAHGLVLHDGRVLLTYGFRHRPYGVRARVCAPDLGDLASTPELALTSDAPHGDAGYPWAVELEPGRVLVVFYGPSPGGIRRIEAVLLEV